MIILSIKTDQPESEFMIFNDHKRLAEIKYLAHRDLAQTIHQKIADLLKKENLNWSDIDGIICYQGPGSFTGLRIGLTMANTLSYALRIPIIGAKSNNWQTEAINKLLNAEDDQQVYPFYDSEPHVTKPKK